MILKRHRSHPPCQIFFSLDNPKTALIQNPTHTHTSPLLRSSGLTVTKLNSNGFASLSLFPHRTSRPFNASTVSAKPTTPLQAHTNHSLSFWVSFLTLSFSPTHPHSLIFHNSDQKAEQLRFPILLYCPRTSS